MPTVPIDNTKSYENATISNRIAKIEKYENFEDTSISEVNVLYYNTYTKELKVGDGTTMLASLQAIHMSSSQEAEIRNIIKFTRDDCYGKIDFTESKLLMHMHELQTKIYISYGIIAVDTIVLILWLIKLFLL